MNNDNKDDNAVADDDNNDNNKTFTISIWLLPSSPERDFLTSMITKFSQPTAASAPFMPHVTILGGIKCSSRKEFQTNLLPKLQQAITEKVTSDSDNGSNTMTCRFSIQPVYHENTWNQACVLVMEESLQFRQLVRTCRDIVNQKESDNKKEDDPDRNDDDDSSSSSWYPPPLGKPHLSLYYGDQNNAPNAKEIVQQLTSSSSSNKNNHNNNNDDEAYYTFQANQVAIWLTDPATAEGVSKWKELAVIDLIPTKTT